MVYKEEPQIRGDEKSVLFEGEEVGRQRRRRERDREESVNPSAQAGIPQIFGDFCNIGADRLRVWNGLNGKARYQLDKRSRRHDPTLTFERIINSDICQQARLNPLTFLGDMENTAFFLKEPFNQTQGGFRDGPRNHGSERLLILVGVTVAKWSAERCVNVPAATHSTQSHDVVISTVISRTASRGTRMLWLSMRRNAPRPCFTCLLGNPSPPPPSHLRVEKVSVEMK
ncbi:TonB-dependent receptor [Anopheles sinensis]|uniref:TonB-dependent receptor n=1 Tax=Anopheles sinensis TaxID=74873 RepID=A0A084WBX5_ANOSI|nr:TonB-dependent receptor [Anopheles sinensis]